MTHLPPLFKNSFLLSKWLLYVLTEQHALQISCYLWIRKLATLTSLLLLFSVFLKPRNSLLGLFDQTVVKVCAIKNTVRRPLLKNIYPFILLAVLTLHRQSWQTGEDERFTFMSIA